MKKNYNILGVITARGGSKGIPGKNIKLLGGKPLIAYAIKSAQKSKLISHLIVSTDDKKIANVAKEYGAEVPFLRPKKLANDTAKHVDVMLHAVKFMERKLNIIFDYVVVLQPTSPFRRSEDIDGILEKIMKCKKAESAVSVYEVGGDAHPVKMKKMKGDKILPYSVKEEEGTRRQDLPVAYKRSGDLYIMKRDLLMKKRKIFGNYTIGYVIPQERVVDIDNEFDWLKAEYIMRKLTNK